MRIGAFIFKSQDALLTDKLNLPVRFIKGKTIEKMLEACGTCLLDDVKSGIWIAGIAKLTVSQDCICNWNIMDNKPN